MLVQRTVLCLNVFLGNFGDFRHGLVDRLGGLDVDGLGVLVLLGVVHGLAGRGVVALRGELATVVTAATAGDGLREGRGKAYCGEEGEHKLHVGGCRGHGVVVGRKIGLGLRYKSECEERM